MTDRRVLIFAPFGGWPVHHQFDAVVGAALFVRGAQVAVLGCDGGFMNCPLAGRPPSLQNCSLCAKVGRELFSLVGLEPTPVGSLLTQQDEQDARACLDRLGPDDLEGMVYEGYPFGLWSLPDVLKFYTTRFLNYRDPDVFQTYKGFLYNNIRLYKALTVAINSFNPDQLLCFNGAKILYHLAFNVCRARGMSVLVHERAPFYEDEGFTVRVNEHMFMIDNEVALMKQWLPVPLSREECQAGLVCLGGNENTATNPLVPYTTEDCTVRERLRIPKDKPLVLLLTSGDWEYKQDTMFSEHLFASQLEGVEKTAQLFAGRDAYLVIRHHPGMANRINLDKPFLARLLAMAPRLPANVRVIMPYENISSYSLMRVAEAALTFGSTTTFEAVLRGCAAASHMSSEIPRMANAPLTAGMPELRQDFAGGYWRLIESLMEKTRSFGLEDLRRAMRAAYFFYARQPMRFRSFGIKAYTNPDFRFSTLQELTPGHDPMLDLVCDHIMTGRPLTREPDAASLARSDAEETAFLTEQLDRLRSVRDAIRRQELERPERPEPRLAVGMLPGRAAVDALGPSLVRSRHAGLKMRAAALPCDDVLPPEALVRFLEKTTEEYVHLCPANVGVDESLYAAAIDFLEEPDNEACFGVMSGAWLLDGGEIADEFFTVRRPAPPDSLEDALALFRDPGALLALFVWRRQKLLHLVRQQVVAGMRDAMPDIFSLIVVAGNQPPMRGLRAPFVVVHRS